MLYNKQYMPAISSKVEAWTEEGIRLLVVFAIGSAFVLGLVLHHLLDKK